MKKFIIASAALLFASACVLNAQKPYTKTFSMDDVIPNATGWSYWFIPTGSVADTLNVKMSCLNNAGLSSHDPHRHPHHELFILLEGDAIIQVNGEDHEFHTGDGCICPGNSAHSLRKSDPDVPIRYLMFNTEAARPGLKKPLPFFKESYTAEDCYVASQKKSFWYLTPEQTCGGLNVRSVLMKGKKTAEYAAENKQLIFVILEGTAKVTVDGSIVELPAMSVCYVPRGSSSSISAVTKQMRYLQVRTQE